MTNQVKTGKRGYACGEEGNAVETGRDQKKLMGRAAL